MNPWELLGIILGWVALSAVVAALVVFVLVVIGVIVGLAKGHKAPNIISDSKLRRKRNV